MNDELCNDLSDLLGTVVDFYLRAHGYHWNVEGEDFSQYHALFESIYSDAYESIDPLAENIRKLGEYAPFKLQTLKDHSILSESRVPTDPRSMAQDLLAASSQVIEQVRKAFHSASAADEQGICNFLADRMDMHQKWVWQLKASLK